MSAEPTAVGVTSTRSAPTSRPRGELPARQEQLHRGHPAGLGRAGTRGEGGIEHVDSTEIIPGPRSPPSRRALDHLARIPSSRTSCMKIAGDAALALPRELLLARASSRAARSARSARDRRALPRPAGTSASRARSRPRRPPSRCRCACRSGSARPGRAARRRRGCRARRCRGRRRARSASRRRRAPRPRSRSIAAWVRAGSAGRTAARRNRRPAARRSHRCRPRGARPAGSPAARIARAEARPGRSETSSSVGAPTIATSTPVELGRVLRCKASRRT